MREQPVFQSRAAVIQARDLQRFQPIFERFFAVVALTVGVFGSILAANGGWERTISLQIRWPAVVAALFVQVAVTLAEWLYKQRRQTGWQTFLATLAEPRYMLALIIDAALTFLGYAPALWPILYPFLHSIAPALAGMLFALIMLAGAILIAWAPETVLVGDQNRE